MARESIFGTLQVIVFQAADLVGKGKNASRSSTIQSRNRGRSWLRFQSKPFFEAAGLARTGVGLPFPRPRSCIIWITVQSLPEVLQRRDVGATKFTTSRGMQPRVVGSRVEAGYSLGVVYAFYSADGFSPLNEKRLTRVSSAYSSWANSECL